MVFLTALNVEFLVSSFQFLPAHANLFVGFAGGHFPARLQGGDVADLLGKFLQAGVEQQMFGLVGATVAISGTDKIV